MGERSARQPATDRRSAAVGGGSRRPLSVAVAQMRSHACDVGAAVAQHVELVDAAATAGAQVVLFPELSLTGYEPDVIDLYQVRVGPDTAALVPLAERCRQRGVHALVGAPIAARDETGRATGLPEIGVLHVDPAGRISHVASKRQLALAEIGIFAAGGAPGGASGRLLIGGHRLALGSASDPAETGAEALLIGGLWLIGGEPQQDGAMRAAAAAGRWVFLAQFCGGTGGGPACGRSGIWQPGGEVAHRLGQESGVVVAQLG
jgi:5-aminopentanamidase